MKFRDMKTHSNAIKSLEEAIADIKDLSIPKEPYAAAKYLLIFAEDILRKDRWMEFHGKDRSERIDLRYKKGLEKLVEAIQGVSVFM